MSSKDIVYKMLANFTCAVCFDTLKIGQLTFCINGHSGCHDCWQTLDTCPVCRDTLIPEKCLELENIITKIPRECTNSEQCTAILDKFDVFEHQQNCFFRKYECPMEGCDMLLAFDDMEIHFQYPHCVEFINMNSSRLKGFSSSLELTQGVIAFFDPIIFIDILYFLHCKLNNGEYHFWLTHVTENIKRKPGRVKLTITEQNSDQVISRVRTNVTQMHKENMSVRAKVGKKINLSVQIMHDEIDYECNYNKLKFSICL